MTEPDFWRCKTCGCLWRDNHDKGQYPGTAIAEGSVSLSSAKQTSCVACENNTLLACEPLYRSSSHVDLDRYSPLLENDEAVMTYDPNGRYLLRDDVVAALPDPHKEPKP